jgi:hypothetical protein
LGPSCARANPMDAAAARADVHRQAKRAAVVHQNRGVLCQVFQVQRRSDTVQSILHELHGRRQLTRTGRNKRRAAVYGQIASQLTEGRSGWTPSQLRLLRRGAGAASDEEFVAAFSELYPTLPHRLERAAILMIVLEYVIPQTPEESSRLRWKIFQEQRARLKANLATLQQDHPVARQLRLSWLSGRLIRAYELRRRSSAVPIMNALVRMGGYCAHTAWTYRGLFDLRDGRIKAAVMALRRSMHADRDEVLRLRGYSKILYEELCSRRATDHDVVAYAAYLKA